jgi:hypothetical protein
MRFVVAHPPLFVIPAKAGIQLNFSQKLKQSWAFSCVLVLYCIVVTPAFGKTKSADDWTYHTNSGGIEFYETRNAAGDKFSITCADKAETELGAGIFITIGPWGAPTNQMISFEIDDSKFVLPTNESGDIRSDDHMAAQAFEFAWPEFRKGKKMTIKFPAGQQAVFSLRGAGKLIPAKICKTTFDKSTAKVTEKSKLDNTENNVQLRIRAICQNKWPNNYEMELFCVEKQTEAAKKLGY